MPSSSNGFHQLVSAKDAERAVALLRVSVDLFAAVDIHSDADIRRFGELCTQLLADVGPECRRFVADRLAHRADAPAQLITALASDSTDVSEPVLLHSPVLTDDDLMQLARQRDDVAAIIARRPGLSADLAAALAAHGLMAQDSHNHRAESDPVAADRPIPTAMPASGNALPAGSLAAIAQSQSLDAIARHIFDMGEDDRRVAIANARHAALAAKVQRRAPTFVLPTEASSADVAERLFKVAIGKNAEAMSDTLATALAISPAMADRIIRDPDGDVLALALAALAIPSEAACSLFLHVNAAAARSAEHLAKLMQLYETLPHGFAGLFVERWRRLDAERPAPITEPTPQRRREPKRIVLKAPASARATGADQRTAQKPDKAGA